MDVSKGIEEASTLAEELSTLTSEVEEDFERIQVAATSEEMAHIYECIDNFVEHVLPSMQRDVVALEKVVGSLQMYHETKNKPVNTFLKGIMGGHDEIPTIPRAMVGTENGNGIGREVEEEEEVSMSEGERLIKYTNTIMMKSAEELMTMIHTKQDDGGGDTTNGGRKIPKNNRETLSVQDDMDIL